MNGQPAQLTCVSTMRLLQWTEGTSLRRSTASLAKKTAYPQFWGLVAGVVALEHRSRRSLHHSRRLGQNLLGLLAIRSPAAERGSSLTPFNYPYRCEDMYTCWQHVHKSWLLETAKMHTRSQKS